MPLCGYAPVIKERHRNDVLHLQHGSTRVVVRLSENIVNYTQLYIAFQHFLSTSGGKLL